jgi:hypothetical protein
MLRRAVPVRTDFSEECSAFIIRVTRTGELRNLPVTSMLHLLVTANHPDDRGAVFPRNIGSYKSHIPEDGVLHSHSRQNQKSYIALTGWSLQRRGNVSPLKYEIGFYIQEDGVFRSHHRENLKSYIALTGWTLQRRSNVSPVKYELGFYIPEDDILHSHCRENLSSYRMNTVM